MSGIRIRGTMTNANNAVSYRLHPEKLLAVKGTYDLVG